MHIKYQLIDIILNVQNIVTYQYCSNTLNIVVKGAPFQVVSGMSLHLEAGNSYFCFSLQNPEFYPLPRKNGNKHVFSASLCAGTISG